MPAFRISSSKLRSPLIRTSRPSMFNVLAATVVIMLPSNDFVSVGFMLWSRGLYADNGFELAGMRTDPALNAERLVDGVRLFLLAGDGMDGTPPGARRAALAFGRVYAGLGQRFALAGGAMLVKYVGVVFLAEMAQRGEDRIGSRLPQPAERAFLYRRSQLLQ